MATILLIEDNEANRILVERVLTAAGHTVLTAVDGATGIELAVGSTPDLLLIDMGLPDIDGQTVVALLKQMPETENIPMVAITAWPAETALETAERYGLSGCILKPIDVRDFPQQISQFLSE
jgi:two-component system, cell cycle response regulator DivK